MKEIVWLYGELKAIHNKIDPRFTPKFGQALFKPLGTYLKLNMVYHLQTKGYIERVNQIIGVTLKIYIANRPKSWEDYLYLTKFTYNDGLNYSLNSMFIKVLYRRDYRPFVCLNIYENHHLFETHNKWYYAITKILTTIFMLWTQS